MCMQSNEPWLICQNGRKGRKRILLAQDASAYYAIDACHYFTRKKRERLASCGVSESLLRELEVPYQRIPKENIRGVAVGGCCALDMIYLYPTSGNRMKFILETNHTKAHVDAFFAGMERFEAPEDRKGEKWNAEYWRREGRDQTAFEQCKPIPWLLTGVSLVCNVGFALTKSRFWCVACLFPIVVGILLTILYPSYFALITAKKGKRNEAWELSAPVYISVFTGICMPALNWLNDWMIPVVALVCGLAVTVTLGLFSEEFRRNRQQLWKVFLIAAAAGWLTVGQINRTFDTSPVQRYYLVAEDVYKSGGRSTSYHCVVTLPDGHKSNLRISRALYEELDEGETVLVEYREGALGIEYAAVSAVDSSLIE